jgi:uncharacterized peroxidase-related enzyme
MVDYALKLTREPAQMREGDVEALRHAGLDDREILDLAMIVAYYGYVNRLADGLGVSLESGREAIKLDPNDPDSAKRG